LKAFREPGRRGKRLMVGLALRECLGRRVIEHASAGYLGGHPPFGYRVDVGRGLVPNPQEQAAIAASRNCGRPASHCARSRKLHDDLGMTVPAMTVGRALSGWHI
jgi:hypothetical protein